MPVSRRFVDLTEPHELAPYDALLAEEAAVRGMEVRHVGRGITGDEALA